ncbi:hypothetical protein [Defluviimonas denitrificans]|jgi:hypothetical protein|uniref:hypothetical protein n=1 Tax=Albidovulum denitrificans TaxID=404881 RepID=UPI000CFD535E|nr:hypothetical protein [Defluviimonas denitrificans]
MKKITTLLCGIAMAAALSTPVHAGGQSTTGSSATPNPAAIVGVYYERVSGMRLEVRADGQGDLYGRSGQRIGSGALDSSYIAGIIGMFEKG